MDQAVRGCLPGAEGPPDVGAGDGPLRPQEEDTTGTGKTGEAGTAESQREEEDQGEWRKYRKESE